MRSTNEIISAVQENKPVTPEELRMALLVMMHVKCFLRHDLYQLIENVIADSPVAKSIAKYADGNRERMFQAMKTDPTEWLGPGNIPGNPEYEERHRRTMELRKEWGVV